MSTQIKQIMSKTLKDADSQRYFELIYAVGNKYPGETRHETALRYIRQAEQAEQEPVAFVSEVYQSRYTLEWNGRSLPVGTKLYAAPVRTKDLTDDEIENAWLSELDWLSGCRAVIAADRKINDDAAREEYWKLKRRINEIEAEHPSVVNTFEC